VRNWAERAKRKGRRVRSQERRRRRRQSSRMRRVLETAAKRLCL